MSIKPTIQTLVATSYIFIASVVAGPLLDAAKNGDSEQVAELLDRGISSHEVGRQGDMPLHWMAYHGNERMARRLIAAGAVVNQQVTKGSTPLHLAAYEGHKGMVLLLLRHGAKVNERTVTGITPLDWAQRNAHHEVAQILIAHGAESDGTTSKVAGAKEPRNRASKNVVAERSLRSRSKVRRLLLELDDDVAENYAESPATEQSLLIDTYRVQIGAFSTEQLAAETRSRYLRRYPDIFGQFDLILKPGSTQHKTYFRVQTRPLSLSDGKRLRERLRRQGQASLLLKAK